MKNTTVIEKTLPKIGKKHINKWVVFSNSSKEILSQGNTLNEALNKVSNKKNTGVMLVSKPLPYSPLSE